MCAPSHLEVTWSTALQESSISKECAAEWTQHHALIESAVSVTDKVWLGMAAPLQSSTLTSSFFGVLDGGAQLPVTV